DLHDSAQDRAGDRLARVGGVRDGAAEDDVVCEQRVDGVHVLVLNCLTEHGTNIFLRWSRRVEVAQRVRARSRTAARADDSGAPRSPRGAADCSSESRLRSPAYSSPCPICSHSARAAAAATSSPLAVLVTCLGVWDAPFAPEVPSWGSSCAMSSVESAEVSPDPASVCTMTGRGAFSARLAPTSRRRRASSYSSTARLSR